MKNSKATKLQATLNQMIPLLTQTAMRLGKALGKKFGTPVATPCGKGFTLTTSDKSAGITFWPQTDQLVVHSQTEVVGTLTVDMKAGFTLSERDLVHLLGQFERIKMAKKTGVDPITGELVLGSMPQAPAPRADGNETA